MIRFTLENLFRAFIRNYGSLDLSEIYYGTHWTNRILGYFESLGRLMGYYVYYEWELYDLTWFENYDKPAEKETPILHIESENDHKRFLVELLNKVKNSCADNIVTIAYPKREEDIVTFDDAVQLHINALAPKRKVSVLAIHDGYHYSPKEINAHILRPNKAMTPFSAIRLNMDDRSKDEGTYYAKMAS